MAHSEPSAADAGNAGAAGPGRRMLPPAGRPPGTRRVLPAGVVLPLLLGIAYGLWAAEIRRSTPAPGPITTGNVVFGVVSGGVVALLAFLLHRMPRRLPAELRAAAWAAYTGAAFGYVYALSDPPVFRTVVIGLLTAGSVFVIAFYRYHTAETPPDTFRHYAAHPRHDRRIPT